MVIFKTKNHHAQIILKKTHMIKTDTKIVAFCMPKNASLSQKHTRKIDDMQYKSFAAILLLLDSPYLVRSLFRA